MTHDSDYGYINEFIDFLRQIIEIIMSLFKGSAKEEDTEAAE